jgi:hypothetical protein
MSIPRFVLALLSVMSSLLAQVPKPASARELSAPASAVFTEAMTWADRAWDEKRGLLRVTHAAHTETTGGKHGVRDTAMYAAALLFRDAPGDRVRAEKAIEGVLGCQWTQPGAPFHGTFARSDDESRPGAGAVIWKDYDPNWRQFIGCCWVIILRRDAEKISPALRERLLGSLQLAMDGEIGQKRLHPSYSNIALMHAFVALNTGLLAGRKDLVSVGEHYTGEVHAEYAKTHSFSEFNSPTYYGVDLFALALWRALGPDAEMRRLGTELESSLWLDVADFYHAGLKNLCGPFDRTYGMDMGAYLSLTGLLMRLELGPELAPLPPLSEHMAHGNDLSAGFLYPQVPSKVPEKALSVFRHFPGPRSVRRELSEGRHASAWLGDSVMIGAEGGGHLKNVEGPDSQYRPATIYWRLPSGAIGWLTLIEGARVDAMAQSKSLRILIKKGAALQIHAQQVEQAQVSRNQWRLPGLTLKVEADGQAFSTVPHAGLLEVRYADSTELVLHVE